MTLFFIALIAGCLTVLAPCVLPLLPVIVGSSINGVASRKKIFVVTTALGVSVIAFTLILKVSTLFVMVPQAVWTYLSGGIVIIFGLITLFPSLWEKLAIAGKINRDSNKLLAVGYQKDSIWGDIIIGASLGPVFSSCSPTYFLVLATVLPERPLVGLVYLLAYTIGLCGMLVVVALVGQKVITKLGVASDPHGWLRRSLGALFVIVGLVIITGVDKKIEAGILNAGFFDITRIEQSLLRKANPDMPLQPSPTTDSGVLATSTTPRTGTATSTPLTTAMRLAAKNARYPKYQEIVRPSGFVNTEGKPITIGQFVGKKVVLLDVWTYSCINCQRTLPYVTAWYDKYKDQGLEIISLHTPEFAFEKVQANVEKAVKDLGVKYPVVLDNDYATWNAYHNNSWPRKYLIDIDGYIVYDHIGEGQYDVTEKEIQKLLMERTAVLGATTTVTQSITVPKNVIDLDTSKLASPETYFGAARNEYLGNGSRGLAGVQNLTLPHSFSPNTLYLGGAWNFSGESAQNTDGAGKVVFEYSAKNVYFVASSAKGVRVRVLRDGKDMGIVTIRDNKLYTLIQGDAYGPHLLELDILDQGLEAFTFTFG